MRGISEGGIFKQRTFLLHHSVVFVLIWVLSDYGGLIYMITRL